MDSPSKNTRNRGKKSKKRFSSEPTTSENIQATANNLPPPRRSPIMRAVSPPLSSTRLSNLIYLLVGLTTLLAAFLAYQTVQHKADFGSWWNFFVDKRSQTCAREESVEERINALASALGMPSSELASAIAGAVRSYVPPASLSSVAAKETGEAVKVLLSESNGGQEYISASNGAAAEIIGGVVGGIVTSMEGFVGMDEP